MLALELLSLSERNPIPLSHPAPRSPITENHTRITRQSRGVLARISRPHEVARFISRPVTKRLSQFIPQMQQMGLVLMERDSRLVCKLA